MLLWRATAAWRRYMLWALVAAILLTLPVAIAQYGNSARDARLAADDVHLKADDDLLQKFVVRATADEVQLHRLAEQNRTNIDTNSAKIETKAAVVDLQALVGQTKAEVVRQIDGIAAVEPAAANTLAAKLLAVLARIDALEARIAALERELTASGASPSPSPSPRGERRFPTPPPRPSPSPGGEHCLFPPYGFCASGSGR
jgi:hypothetical protein